MLGRLNLLNRFFATSTRPTGQTYKLVFVRHGESTWNKENRFTGWHDVELTQTGIEQAKSAGEVLKANNFHFDICYTSNLTRAVNTWNVLADAHGCSYVPLQKSWRLNERHYGALTGLNKAETAKKHGEEQVLVWRRSYDIPPPGLQDGDERLSEYDRRYNGLPPDILPRSECLKDCLERVLPFWYDEICPTIYSGKNVIVTAHGNSIRALVKHIEQISDADIMGVNIPNGTPLVYELDDNMRALNSYYLEDPEVLAAKMDAVKNQGKQ